MEAKVKAIDLYITYATDEHTENDHGQIRMYTDLEDTTIKEAQDIITQMVELLPSAITEQPSVEAA